MLGEDFDKSLGQQGDFQLTILWELTLNTLIIEGMCLKLQSCFTTDETLGLALEKSLILVKQQKEKKMYIEMLMTSTGNEI